MTAAIAVAAGMTACKVDTYRPPDIVVFFDPTILEPSDTTGRDAVLAELRRVLSTITPTGRVTTYLIGNASDTRAADKFVSPRMKAVGSHNLYKAAVRARVDTLMRLLSSRWNLAHTDSAFPMLASCVLGTTKKLNDNIRKADSTFQAYAILVSDLVEACKDFGDLSFERGASELKKLSPLRFNVFNLDRFAGIYVLRPPHKSFQRIGDVIALETFWDSVFTAAHAPAGNRYLLGTDLPTLAGWCTDPSMAGCER